MDGFSGGRAGSKSEGEGEGSCRFFATDFFYPRNFFNGLEARKLKKKLVGLVWFR